MPLSSPPVTQGAGYGGTSATSLSVATGAKVFATQSGLAYKVGARMRASAVADATGATFIEGIVTAYSGTSLTLTVDTLGANGGSSFSSWNFNIAASQFAIPGVVDLGGGQINNVIIGTANPLAGFFTALAAASLIVTGASASLIAAGPNGSTNPAFRVDASTASSATGLQVKSAAAGAGVAVAAISSAGSENLTVDAKGSGTIALGSVSTGAITLSRATTLSAALTYGGVTLNNAVTGTGNMVLSVNATLTGTTAVAALTATTINGNTFTAGTFTLTGGGGKTLTFNNSLTLAGTDGVTLTFPGTNATIARTDAGQTFTGTQVFAAGNAATPGVTVGLAGYGLYQSGTGLAFAVGGGTLMDFGISASGKFSFGAPTVFLASAVSTFSLGGIGYGAGAGGTATQATSKATAVPLNAVTGAITMNNAALAAGTIVSFAFTNSAIAATDMIDVAHESGGTMGGYTLNGRATGAGTGAIDVRNNTAGSLSEAIVLRFKVFKSVNA